MAIIERLRALMGRGDRYVLHYTPEMYPAVDGLTPRTLYSTQANLHAVVSFLADSVAQLPLKVYQRDGETDRHRDRDSVAARLLYRPNADQTAYEFINAVMIEYLLMGEVAVWVLPDSDSDSGYQLRIIPKEWTKTTDADTNYAPSVLHVAANGRIIDIPSSEFVMFRMYSPGNPGGWQSPCAALRQTLSEQIQADRFRKEIWRSSGRFNAYLTRPKDVQPWDDGQRERFLTAFREGWGANGENTGKMPLLEDGMEIKPYQFNAKEAQYSETKQLSREDVAAAYHVNPSLIWHTTTQTYASAKDNARALYADCLGPTLQMLQQRINAFLLPMIGADASIYVEFDLNEKLKGSFEERAGILQSAVGAPYMTRNEARADSNLPPIEGGDALIVPLNVNDGVNNPEVDQNASQEPAEPSQEPAKMRKKSEAVRIKAKTSKEEADKVADVIKKTARRQAQSIKPKIAAGKEEWWDGKRWDDELAEDLEPVLDEIGKAHGTATAKQIGSIYHPEWTVNYLATVAGSRAHAINEKTRRDIEKALDELDEDEDALDKTFDRRSGNDAVLLGLNLAKDVAGFALVESCNQAKSEGNPAAMFKVWVTGENSRPSHAAMDGQMVKIDEEFTNGAKWPGDDNLDPDESCGCNCQVEVAIM